MGSQRKNIMIFLAVVIICATIIVINQNTRIRRFNIEIKYRGFQISTEAEYKAPKEKVTDVRNTNDNSHE